MMQVLFVFRNVGCEQEPALYVYLKNKEIGDNGQKRGTN